MSKPPPARPRARLSRRLQWFPGLVVLVTSLNADLGPASASATSIGASAVVVDLQETAPAVTTKGDARLPVLRFDPDAQPPRLSLPSFQSSNAYAIQFPPAVTVNALDSDRSVQLQVLGEATTVLGGVTAVRFMLPAAASLQGVYRGVLPLRIEHE